MAKPITKSFLMKAKPTSVNGEGTSFFTVAEGAVDSLTQRRTFYLIPASYYGPDTDVTTEKVIPTALIIDLF